MLIIKKITDMDNLHQRKEIICIYGGGAGNTDIYLTLIVKK